MDARSDIGRLTLREPILKWLFVRKEVGVSKRRNAVSRRGAKSVVPYGDEYGKVQSFYRFVE